MNTMNDQARWDAVADTADRFFSLLGPASSKLLELGKLFPGAVVLELGCGTGGLARMAAERVGAGGKVVGIDTSPAMIARAKEGAGAHPNLKYYVHDAHVLNFPEGACDVVFCQLALPFFADPARALSRAMAILKPGGRLVLMGLGAPEHNRFFSECGPEARERFSVVMARRDGDLLERAGYQEIRTRPIRALVQVADRASHWGVVRGALGIPAASSPSMERIPIGAQLPLEVCFILARKPDPNAPASYDLKTFDHVVARARRRIRELAPHEVTRNLRKQQVCYLDVREIDELAGGTIKGAFHIPRGELELRVTAAVPDRSAAIVTYCQDGNIGALAAARLLEMGYGNVWNLSGGIAAWQQDRMPLETRR